MQLPLPARLVFDTQIEDTTEDGGQARIVELSSADPHLYVRLISWDEARPPAHPTLTQMMAHPGALRVSVEIAPVDTGGDPEAMDDADLETLRLAATQAVIEAQRQLCALAHPRAQATAEQHDLARLDLHEAQERLAEIDGVLRGRMR